MLPLFFLLLAAPAQAALVYEREGEQIVVAADDGSAPRVVATGTGPRVSPDGRWVAFRAGLGTLSVVSTRGGAPRTLFEARNLGDPVADWSPDSRRLVPRTGDLSVHVVSLSGDHREYSTEACPQGGVFAPDGRSYEFTSSCMSESNRLRLTLRTGRLESLGSGYGILSAARGVVWTDDNYQRGVGASVWQIFWAPPRGRSRIVMSSTTGSIAAVDWYRDGRLLVARSTPGSTRMRAGLLDPRSGRLRLLPYEYDRVLGLARDGRHVIGWAGGGMSTDYGTLVRVAVRSGAARVLAERVRYASWA
jgi:Tol biopolymer transport system component